MNKKAVKYSVYVISLISEGFVRRDSRRLHGPESNKKTWKLQCVRESWVLEVRGKRKLLDDSRSPLVVKKVVKHYVFVISLIAKGLVRRVSRGIIAPERRQKANKLQCVREGSVIESP